MDRNAFVAGGASSNPANRFETLRYDVDLDWSDVPEEERPAPRTRFYRDASESIIARNDSPDRNTSAASPISTATSNTQALV